MFVAFGVFIAACGATHFVEIWTLWQPVYWFAGSVKVVTAAASVFTAVALPPLVPVALGTTRAAKLSEKRKLELEDANTELRTLYAKLREADEVKTRFFANVSHELRTPLALILGPAESLLEAGKLPDADRRHVETVHRNANLLLTHVNDLLDISKLEAGPMDVHYARADLTRIVRLAASHFESLAQQRQITYTVQTPETLPAEVDPDKIGRILFNLLGNAFKFAPAGGRVRCILGTREVAGNPCATIAVHDSGPGIAPEQREVVFEPLPLHGSGRWNRARSCNREGVRRPA
jgi:signal transduction histidine kinase